MTEKKNLFQEKTTGHCGKFCILSSSGYLMARATAHTRNAQYDKLKVVKRVGFFIIAQTQLVFLHLVDVSDKVVR